MLAPEVEARPWAKQLELDELPDIPGLRQQWGRGVVVCPYCDGWEHRNDVIGVVATSPHSIEQAQMLRQW